MSTSRNKRGQLLSEGVFLELERRVINNIYPPGSHLVEDEIAEDLGVSRTPVREAFKALERIGLLEIRPHAGAYVRHTTFEEVRDVFEVRQWLEERAARAAAERITDPQIKSLRIVLERGHKAVEKGNNDRTLASLNSAFHGGLAEASGNSVLGQMLNGILKHVHHRYFTAVAERRGSDSWGEHDAILDAIVSGQADRAARLTIEHLDKTREAFLRYLDTRHRSPLKIQGADGPRSIGAKA